MLSFPFLITTLEYKNIEQCDSVETLESDFEDFSPPTPPTGKSRRPGQLVPPPLFFLLATVA